MMRVMAARAQRKEGTTKFTKAPFDNGRMEKDKLYATNNYSGVGGKTFLEKDSTPYYSPIER